ncbi:MAG: HD-GYP domain-containing protein [Rhodospirillales bacterium]
MLLHIVDDDSTNLLLFRKLASKAADDLDIMTFEHAEPAIEAFAKDQPDLVIVDYMMPDIDGHAYLETVRSFPNSSEIPIVMITAAGDKEVRLKALERGATDFLSKPVDTTEFKVRMQNLLALRRAGRQLSDRAVLLAAEVAKATEKIESRTQELIIRLSRAAEFRDPETGAHIQRMSHFSALIANRLGLDAATCDRLLRAAPMHDVGKLGTPDAILLKPGRLDPDEFEIMKQHAINGYHILKDSEADLIQLGAEIAHTHHEKYDGSGYPRGLKGEEIPLLGRIVAVADVFDALTSERPYKKAWSLDDARQLLIDGKGKHFDPKVVDAFLSAWNDVLAIRENFKDEEGHEPKL